METRDSLLEKALLLKPQARQNKGHTSGAHFWRSRLKNEYCVRFTRPRGDGRCFIIYSIESEYIYIVAVAHCHGQPDYWIDRIIQ